MTMFDVSIRTNLNAGSPILIQPFDDSDPSPTNPAVKWLQPEVTISLPTGDKIIAPFGAPVRNDLPLVLAGLALAAVAFMGLGALVKIPPVVTAVAAIGAVGSGAKMLAG